MKKIIALALSALLLVGAAVVGTVAFLTDTDQAINVMTSGNIEIDQLEKQRKDISTGELESFVNSDMFPAFTMDPVDEWPTESVSLEGLAGTYSMWNPGTVKNVKDKIVYVENTGKNPAYVRTFFAFENPFGADFEKKIVLNWNVDAEEIMDTKIGDVNYKIYVVTYLDPISAGTFSAPSLLQFAFAETADNADMKAIDGSLEVLAFTEAVQVEGFEEATKALTRVFGDVTKGYHPWTEFTPGILVQNAEQLQTALNKGGKVTLVGNIQLTEALTIPAPAASTFSLRSTPAVTVLDLNGYTISNENGYVIENEGNLVITGNGTLAGLGGIRSNGGSIVIENGNFYASSRWQDGVYQHTLKAVNTEVVINGGNFDATVNGQTNAVLNASEGATITINAGTFKNVAGELTQFDPYLFTYEKDGKVVINGGSFYGGWRFNGETTSTEIYGGTFTVSFDGQSFHANSTHTVTVYGGAFSAGSKLAGKLESIIADGYEVTENADGTYTVSMRLDLIDSSDKLIAAIKNAADGTKLLVAPGNYNLHFTNHTTFNVDNLTIVGVAGENPVTFTITSSEAWYGRVQGDNVTFENIYFKDSVGATGEATYNNCIVDGWLILASSNEEKTYVNNCEVGIINTSTDFTSGVAYVKGSTIAKADYSARKDLYFENCTIGELLSHGGNTVLKNCKVDSIVIKGGTVIIDGKYFANSATSLQAALNAATGDAEIVLGADITGDVTVTQKANVKITIDGKGHQFAGVLLVDGKSATIMTAGLTIQDVVFKADSISADACVQLGKDNNTRYTCNVTLSGCTFDVPGAVGVKSYTGGDKNLTISGCTATANAHSLVQAKGIDSILVENCKVYSKNGLNFNNSPNVTVRGCTIDVKGYAVRFGEGTANNGNAETYLIEKCSLKSACDDGDAVIVLRGTADNSTLTLKNNTIEGTAKIANTTTNATVVEVNG